MFLFGEICLTWRRGGVLSLVDIPVPALQVVREEDDGLVISGMKMLATGAVLANEVWLGNVIPLAPDQKKQAVTCSLPMNAKGLSLWSRKPFEREAKSEFDAPLAWRYDETDSMVMCERSAISTSRRRATASATTSPTCASG